MFVVPDSTNAITAAIGVGTGPFGVAFDSHNHEIYVANNGATVVSVISDSTNKVGKNITVGMQPNSIAFDTKQKRIVRYKLALKHCQRHLRFEQ